MIVRTYPFGPDLPTLNRRLTEDAELAALLRDGWEVLSAWTAESQGQPFGQLIVIMQRPTVRPASPDTHSVAFLAFFAAVVATPVAMLTAWLFA